MNIVTVILVVVSAYAAAGLIFAVAFVTVGIGRVDPAGRGAPLSLRIALIGGCAALWPLMARKWMTARQPEDEP